MRVLLLLLCIISVTKVRAQYQPKVILVIADGIPADVIERLQPPHLQQIIDKGAYKRSFTGGIPGTYTETPTISAPGYNNMLTGTWAYKHNVWNNYNQHPNYSYPTIFKLFKNARPAGTTGIFSTWTDNREVLLGSGQLTPDYICDGYEKDTLRFPHDKPGRYIHHIDEQVVHCADSVIRQHAPDLSWIYLEYTDDVGHGTGTGPAFDSAVLLFDRQMKIINDAIAYREASFREKWLLLITTDHGRDSVKGHDHGGQSNRERTTWIILNQPVTNAYFSGHTPAVVDILPSVANYLHVNIPPSATRELDGVPFIGNVSLGNAAVQVRGDSLTVSWNSFMPDDTVAVYISYTNNTKQGGTDNYELLGTTLSANGQLRCRLNGLSTKPFFKVVAEGKYNKANAWHMAEKPRR